MARSDFDQLKDLVVSFLTQQAGRGAVPVPYSTICDALGARGAQHDAIVSMALLDLVISKRVRRVPVPFPDGVGQKGVAYQATAAAVEAAIGLEVAELDDAAAAAELKELKELLS